jgi:putative membrane protein
VAANVKGYWEWANDGLYYDIPTQNFIGWFGLSLIFSWLLQRHERAVDPLFIQHGVYLFVMLHALFGVTAVNAGLYGIGLLSILTSGVILLERRGRDDRVTQKEMVQ